MKKYRELTREEYEKRATRGKRWMVVLIICSLLVWAALIGGVLYLESILGLINRADEEMLETMSPEAYQQLLDSMEPERLPEDYSGEILGEEDVQWGDAAQQLEQSSDVVNILLIGQDTQAQESRSRTDTLILLTLNKPAQTLTLTSFMRDLYVQIPGYRDNRINVPYLLGGLPLLNDCLDVNFGVAVDGNIVVDFYGFIDIVDMMGGIEIELTAEEAEYMNENYSWDVDDGVDDDWNMTEGVNHLGGTQALSYARMRNVGNSDYQRTERQRIVLTKLIEKAKTLSASELTLLLNHALPMVTTDMESTELMSYLLEVIPMLPQLQINTQRIPVDGTYKSVYIDGMAVLLPDLEANRCALAQIMQVLEK